MKKKCLQCGFIYSDCLLPEEATCHRCEGANLIEYHVLINVSNNYNCICEDCLKDIKDHELYQPAFKEVVAHGTCEHCGYSH